MAKGSLILINGSEPKGRFRSGIISGTPKPGQQMQIKAATEPVNGLFTFEAVDAASPNQTPFILLEDEQQGCTASTAYVSGTVCRVYTPLPGDELNLLFANVAGTGDTFAIGDKAVVNNVGKFVEDTGTPYHKVTVEETVSTALTADTLIACTW